MLKQAHTATTFLLLLALTAVPGDAQEQAHSKASVQARAASPISGAERTPVTDDPNYKIGEQDVLDVSVWREPDLSRQVPVRPDGKISLPLLNDLQAAGLTPAQLASEIKESLNKYMTNPQVTVIVSQVNSQRVYILGEVTRAGAYVLLRDMTVLQALSNAGGFTPFANVKNIYVLRHQSGKQERLFFNYKEVISGKRTEQNVELKAGDTIIVP
jgi:polysaccharide export outer membrane protein